MLESVDAAQLLDSARRIFEEKSAFDVRTFTVVDGREEGTNMWRTVDALQRRAGLNIDTVGSIDLGGGSTQIAFPTVSGSIYVHSHLKFGINEARYRCETTINI